MREISRPFVIKSDRPRHDKLVSGLRDKIRLVLSSMNTCKCISVDYLRLGYNEVGQKKTVVVFITVEKDQEPQSEAQRITNALPVEI
jgi:hypothetical protein